MSYRALSRAARVTDLRPLEKLLLMQIAHSHHGQTGDCTPSLSRLSLTTGMGRDQILRLVRTLESRGYVTQTECRRGYLLHFVETEGLQVPVNWWPSDGAIQRLTDAYPSHHFDTAEAVNDFIRYARTKDRRYPAHELDDAFVRNISALLDHREPGPVAFAIREDDAAADSVGARLASM